MSSQKNITMPAQEITGQISPKRIGRGRRISISRRATTAKINRKRPIISDGPQQPRRSKRATTKPLII